jgi:hypothetical protein
VKDASGFVRAEVWLAQSLIQPGHFAIDALIPEPKSKVGELLFEIWNDARFRKGFGDEAFNGLVKRIEH